MKTDRMDRRTAEWLLDGPTDAGPADAGPLVLLLGALRAAPRPGEFAGEAAAVAAYRRALAGHPGPVPATEPVGAPSRLWGAVTAITARAGEGRGRLTRTGARVGLVALTVATTGGVALAATGTLPGTRPPAPPPGAPATTPPSAPATGVTPGTPPSTGHAGTDSGVPDAALPGLCRAFRARTGDDPARALDGQAFAALVAAAGGRDRVPGYCDEVLADDVPYGPGRSPHPSQSGRHPSTPSATPPGHARLTASPPATPPGHASPPAAPPERVHPTASAQPAGAVTDGPGNRPDGAPRGDAPRVPADPPSRRGR